jgi:hypothetical protein
MALVSQGPEECVGIKRKHNRGEEEMRVKRRETNIVSFE